MANVRQIQVTEPEQMQLEITRLVSAGFMVASQNNRSVTLIKRKQFSIAAMVIGFFLCVVPLLIYLVVYALQQDQVVEIVMLDGPIVPPYRGSEHLPDAPPLTNPGPVLQLSPDRQQWWDGISWRSTGESVPPHAVRQPDGSHWWDGTTWRPVPPGA